MESNLTTHEEERENEMVRRKERRKESDGGRHCVYPAFCHTRGTHMTQQSTLLLTSCCGTTLKCAGGGCVGMSTLLTLSRWLVARGGGDGGGALWSTNHRSKAGSVTMSKRPALAHFLREVWWLLSIILYSTIYKSMNQQLTTHVLDLTHTWLSNPLFSPRHAQELIH